MRIDSDKAMTFTGDSVDLGLFMSSMLHESLLVPIILLLVSTQSNLSVVKRYTTCRPNVVFLHILVKDRSSASVPLKAMNKPMF